VRKINVFYIPSPEKDRWIPGDRFIRPWIRKIIRGKPKTGGIEKVFLNLCESLRRCNINFCINPSVKEIKPEEVNILLGRGIESASIFKNKECFIAGIGFSTHPLEFPDFPDKYNVKAYLSHCGWINTIYAHTWGDICTTWPVGIDTEEWKPDSSIDKKNEFLIYHKIRWDIEAVEKKIFYPILNILDQRGIQYKVLRYGQYRESEYKSLLKESRNLLFICEHETQGIACNEALSCDIPVLAWDEGILRDPYYIRLGSGHIPCTSVPFFDERCGNTFQNMNDFETSLDAFLLKQKEGLLQPRNYILENISMEKSVERLFEIISEKYPNTNI